MHKFQKTNKIIFNAPLCFGMIVITNKVPILLSLFGCTSLVACIFLFCSNDYFVPFCFSFFYFHVTKMLYEMNDINSPQWHEFNQYCIFVKRNHKLLFNFFNISFLWPIHFHISTNSTTMEGPSSFQWVEDNCDPIIRHNNWIASSLVLCWIMI